MSRLPNVRILVIEDNIDLAENLSEILEDEGASIRIAASACAARASLNQGFDVALVDVNLPDSSGLSLLSELKQACDGLAEVVLISGYATIEDAIEAVSGRAYAYILKPFRVEDIVATVERAWRQVRSSRTERHLATEVRKRESGLRTLVETVQALLIVLDDNGQVVQANSAAASLTGVAPEELIGRRWFEEFVVTDNALPWAEVLDRLAQGEAHVSLENQVHTADHADQRVVSWRFARVRDDHGGPLTYASGLDVTELKELEKRTQLDQRLAAIGTLAAGLAHEIRNPLNSAQLQLRLLARRVSKLTDDSAVSEPIALVEHEIQRLSALVQEFLTFARPSVLAIDDADLVTIARRVVELEKPAALSHQVELEFVAEPAVQVRADGNKIQQVLLNLVRNAVEAARESDAGPRRVKVRVARRGTGAAVHVSDTGEGMSQAVMARLFEPFFSTKQSGTGLGMSICHSLVTQHGGQLDVRSELGRGTDIAVYLPRQPPAKGSLRG